MPIGRSAKKSLRKSLKLRKSNNMFKSKLKDLLKKYLAKPSEKGLTEVQSILDKAKKKNIWHINRISRIKSRLSREVTKTAEAPVKIVKKTIKKTVKRTAKEKMSK